MKTSIKVLQDISGLHDTRTYTGAVRKSAKPDLPTTAILGLYMRRNERDRIVQELKRLKKRKMQLRMRLEEVEKEMTMLLGKATKTAVEMRGIPGKRGNPIRGSEKKERLVLGY